MENDERKVILLTDAIETEKVSVSRERLHYLLERSRALRWARAIALTALIVCAILIAGLSYQRGQIHLLQNEVGTLKAEKERKPLAPPAQHRVEIQPC
jgi:hypothetical protein